LSSSLVRIPLLILRIRINSPYVRILVRFCPIPRPLPFLSS